MAAGDLQYAVHFADDKGESHVFVPGDDIPGWALDKIAAHCFEDGQKPKSSKSAKKDSGDSGDGPPPQSGRGSGRDAWAAYAAANGVDVDDEATKDEIVVACDDAGVPVE